MGNHDFCKTLEAYLNEMGGPPDSVRDKQVLNRIKDSYTPAKISLELDKDGKIESLEYVKIDKYLGERLYSLKRISEGSYYEEVYKTDNKGNKDTSSNPTWRLSDEEDILRELAELIDKKGLGKITLTKSGKERIFEGPALIPAGKKEIQAIIDRTLSNKVLIKPDGVLLDFAGILGSKNNQKSKD